MMTLDQKQDLRLRMLDLERKLTESEQERSKLEKTCNALIKAFREEEKLRYRALNEKYEKFLQDCSIRKRRNDIILRSLCRIEDRSRALFAKTERLKLLKNRYISCLRQNEEKKEETLTLSRQNFIPTQRISDSYKTVQWKTPLTNEPRALVTSITSKKHYEGIVSYKHPEEYTPRKLATEAESAILTSTDPRSEESENKIQPEKSRQEKKSEQGIDTEIENVANVKALREKVVLNHQESIEKLKKTLSEEFSDEEFPTPKHDLEEEKKDEEKTLPMGLDGVDYENETYPESYYEQPVHQNHTSISADVILEEDETEEEEKEDISDEKSQGDQGSWQQTTELKPAVNEEPKNLQKSESESLKSSEIRKPVKSTLMHLLDSDSESFQIEHGDRASGNEDSDFDFSFH